MTRPVRWAAILAVFGLLVIGIIMFKQDAEWRQLGWSKGRHQMYYLPSPAVLERLSLGHRSFLADLVWIRGLLYVGTHFSQGGTIDWLPRYTQSIVSLEPQFRYAYVWGAILIVYNRKTTTREDILTSIQFLKMGQQQFPHDYYFPYALGMSYLGELTVGRRTIPQLIQDFQDFCPNSQKPVLALPPTAFAWQACLDHPASWIHDPQCSAENFVHNTVAFSEAVQAQQKQRIPMIRQIRRCLRKTAALYLMEASSKEGAPNHYAPLAARIMRRDGDPNAAICDHLLHVIWRAESDDVRKRIRERINRYCDGKRPAEIICQEEYFAKRWREQFAYIPRTTFQMLDIPSILEHNQPLVYPLPQEQQTCSFR